MKVNAVEFVCEWPFRLYSFTYIVKNDFNSFYIWMLRFVWNIFMHECNKLSVKEWEDFIDDGHKVTTRDVSVRFKLLLTI